jgi:hypothetical protein
VWIDEADCETLRAFIRFCGVPVITSKPDGTILWANEEFCEWSGYTLQELKSIGWKKISVTDENLEADVRAASELSIYRLSYSVQKQYIPKNDKPQWGTLHVIRFPVSGPISFCVCIWQPLKNGSQAAFNMAMTELGKITSQLESCKIEVSKLTSVSEEERLANSVIAVIRKYPKVTWSIVVVLLTLFGLNNLLQIATGLNLTPAPTVKVEAPSP